MNFAVRVLEECVNAIDTLISSYYYYYRSLRPLAGFELRFNHTFAGNGDDDPAANYPHQN
eukprot:scaffold1129_cov164-Ochromonas_danica.AAC.10